MHPDDLELRALRAGVRHLCAEVGLRAELSETDDGFQAVLSADEDPEEVFVAVGVRGGGYLSLSLLLVVEEAFFGEHVNRILEISSRFDVCASTVRDERLPPGEVYLSLALRIFQEGLGPGVFGLALENLRAARDSLAEAFP